MGKPKGKRAHRKIDLGEDAYIAKKQEDAAAGGAVDELPDDSLFFVDNDGGIAAGGGMAFPSRKEKARAKVLRVDAILTKAKTAKSFPVPIPRGAKGPPTKSFATKGAELAKVSKAELAKRGASGKRGVARASDPAAEKISGKALYKPNRRFTLDDVLNDDPDAPEALNPYDLWGSGVDPKRRPVTAKQAVYRKAGTKAAEAAAYSKHRLGDEPRAAPKRSVPYKPSTGAPAVRVDAVGCSYNPPEDARQDVVAEEVGRLTAAKLRKQLDPIKAPVSNNEANALLSEELYYAQDKLYEEEEEEERDGEGGTKNPAVTRDGKMTKAQRNKQTRAREQRAAEEANRLAKRQRHELSNLKALKSRLEEEEAAAADKQERRKVAREERRAEAPRRLGKHRFTPEPSAVLLTEEVTGSLRQLPGSHTLLRDRLKSLERRELVEPRKKVFKTKSKNYMKYEPGAKGERELEMHESALKVTEATRKMKAQVTL